MKIIDLPIKLKNKILDYHICIIKILDIDDCYYKHNNQISNYKNVDLGSYNSYKTIQNYMNKCKNINYMRLYMWAEHFYPLIVDDSVNCDIITEFSYEMNTFQYILKCLNHFIDFKIIHTYLTYKSYESIIVLNKNNITYTLYPYSKNEYYELLVKLKNFLDNDESDRISYIHDNPMYRNNIAKLLLFF